MSSVTFLRNSLCAFATFFPTGHSSHLFGSRPRGDAESDSDMDILVEVERDRVTFPEKQAIRRVIGEFSIETDVIISLLIVDNHILQERGDFSLFQNIRDEGIPA